VKIVDLQRGDLYPIRTGTPASVRVLFGRIWITEPGRRDDLFAGAGDELTVRPKGEALVEALGFARLTITAQREPAARPAQRAASHSTWRRWMGARAAVATPGGHVSATV
jgi:hypothetical protein